MSILVSGLHHNVAASSYHADQFSVQPSLSSGVLRTILEKSIEHAALEHPRIGGKKRKATDAMNIGSIVHGLLAGPCSELSIGEFDSFHSKAAREWKEAEEAAGKTPVLERDLAAARPIVEAIRNKIAVGITNDPFSTNGSSEVTALWKDGDVWCRARYDRLVIDPTGYADIWDWKIVEDISDRGIERAIVRYGYHIQAAFYLRGLAALLPSHRGRMSFIFGFAESSPPYHVRRVVLSSTFMAIGARKVNEGLGIWQRALAAGDFSAPAHGTFEVEAPAYMDDDTEISASTAAA